MKIKSYLPPLFLLTASSSAWAAPPGPVSSGATEVAAEGKELPTHVDAAITDATEASVQGGGLLAGGNSRSFALTAAGRFLLRRGASEFNARAAMNYAQSALDRESSPGTTVENYQGRLRYDYFLDTQVSAFLAVAARRDRFQGLDMRMGIDPGVSAYLIRNDEIKLWGEVGYSLQLDLFNEDAQAARLLLDPVPSNLGFQEDHNARVYLGYQHRFDGRLSLDTGFEGFKSLLHENRYRFNFSAQLTTQLIDKLSFGVGAQTLYDNEPVPGVQKLDVLSSFNFVYTLL